MKPLNKPLLATTVFLCFLFVRIAFVTCQPIKTLNEWKFKVTQVADKVWAIDDNGSDMMYLVEGKDSALLIDTGMGVGKLDKCIKSITKLPVIIINTHGHPDHAGGNYEFANVYAHEADFGLIRYFTSQEYRKTMIQSMYKGSQLPDSATINAMINTKPTPTLAIKEGYIFDLGGRHIEVIEVPGHTKGSIVLLDAVNKILFSGDNDNQLVWLFLADCTPLEIYLQSLQHLKERDNQYITIMPGHGQPLDKSFIGEQIICAQNILNGTCTPEPYQSFAGSASLCKYKSSSIAYNPNNLRIQK